MKTIQVPVNSKYRHLPKLEANQHMTRDYIDEYMSALKSEMMIGNKVLVFEKTLLDVQCRWIYKSMPIEKIATLFLTVGDNGVADRLPTVIVIGLGERDIGIATTVNDRGVRELVPIYMDSITDISKL